MRRHLNYTTDGGYANGNNLTKATDGNLYGMLYQGGSSGYGTIFKLTPGGTFTVIKHLNYATHGGYPKGSLIQSTDGNFYGLMQSGGSMGYGTVFKCTPGGTFTVLKNLDAVPNGGNPQGSLLRNSSDGNFYGTTSFGGAGSGGTIFKITPAGLYAVLVHLPESSGVTPEGSVVQGRDGSFYGMTKEGGTYSAGSIFKFCNNTFTSLTSFNAATNGAGPQGNLI